MNRKFRSAPFFEYKYRTASLDLLNRFIKEKKVSLKKENKISMQYETPMEKCILASFECNFNSIECIVTLFLELFRYVMSI